MKPVRAAETNSRYPEPEHRTRKLIPGFMIVSINDLRFALDLEPDTLAPLLECLERKSILTQTFP